MATSDRPVPAKLKQDAIVEAVFEMRFDTPTIPEIFFGRLSEYGPWKGFQQRRLPAYEIPAPMRQVNPDLRFQPIYELLDPERRIVRIGEHVLSYHRLVPYVGWDKFRVELNEAIHGVFEKAEAPIIRRLGLRYMNSLTAEVHGISSILDLDLNLVIASEPVSGNVNVNFTTRLSEDTQCTVRVATPDFIQGTLPPKIAVFVDVDVFTKDSFRTKEESKVKEWTEFAHTGEKKQFFRLLKNDTIEALREN